MTYESFSFPNRSLYAAGVTRKRKNTEIDMWVQHLVKVTIEITGIANLGGNVRTIIIGVGRKKMRFSSLLVRRRVF